MKDHAADPAEVLAEVAREPGKAACLPLEIAASALALASGVCEMLRARVIALQVSVDLERTLPEANDRVLDIAEAARRLNVSRDYLYRRHAELPFTVRHGRRLGFSERGLTSYLRRAQRASS